MSARKIMVEAWALRQGASHGIAAVEVDALLGIVDIAGFAVVPKIPSDEMYRAAAEFDENSFDSATKVWRAMLKASEGEAT